MNRGRLRLGVLLGIVMAILFFFSNHASIAIVANHLTLAWISRLIQQFTVDNVNILTLEQHLKNAAAAQVESCYVLSLYL